jgi:DHA1 family tetracycline resistance protein-like MFS transporter
MTEPKSPPGLRGATVAFIFVSLVLSMLSLGMVIPVLPKLVEKFLGGDTARAAEVFGLFSTAWALMQFLSTPVHGALSDRFGRRPMLLASNIGLGFDYILMALAPNLIWLFAGRIISGIASASISTSFAYIADVTPSEQRSVKFGLLSAAIAIGFVLGPALGGVLGAIDPRLPFWVAAGFSLANALYGIFVLPESLPPERRSPLIWRNANPLGSLRLLRSDPVLRGLAGVNFIANLAFVALTSTFVLYTSYRFGWSEDAVGIALGVFGLSLVIVQMGFVRLLVKRVGERNLMLAGYLLGAAGFIVMGLADNYAVAWVSIPLAALWGFSGPTMQALMSHKVSASQQGALQGANGSMVGIAQFIGPGIFTQTFAYFIGAGRGWNLPGMPYLLAAFLFVISAALAWRVTRPR